VVRLLVTAAGYEVITASTPPEALRLAMYSSFVVIVMDNWYEAGSGAELCKQPSRASHRPRSYTRFKMRIFYIGCIVLICRSPRGYKLVFM
jgi:hypothetical protein